MQTIIVPWSADDDTRATVRGWQRAFASMVRTGYAKGQDRSASEIEAIIKARFPSQSLGSWAAHCAAYEAKSLRTKVPNGTMIFGGKAELLRRQKGQISNEQWKDRRHGRCLKITGDRTRWGNRHFRLAEDGSTCAVEFLGKRLILSLSSMTGKYGKLVRAVAVLANSCQMSIQFGLKAKTLTITFDEMDLRKLPSGKTLEELKMAEQAGGRKGRKRKNISTHYASHRVKNLDNRPIHPEWREPVNSISNRAIGIDLNPQWIGISVIQVTENPQHIENVRVLDHRLHHISIPINSDAANMTRVMANIAADIINVARAWNCSLIVHEDGLGKLSWSKKSGTDQTVNYWSRNALVTGLARRCKLSSIKFLPVWGGYSTTIGNMVFDLPDACASAAEIARRGYASTCGIKDRLPAVPPMVHLRRWKDEDVPVSVAQALTNADGWPAVHRAIKPAQRGSRKAMTVGYRRLHPPAKLMVPGSVVNLHSKRYAVNRMGNGKGASCSARPVQKY